MVRGVVVDQGYFGCVGEKKRELGEILGSEAGVEGVEEFDEMGVGVFRGLIGGEGGEVQVGCGVGAG